METATKKLYEGMFLVDSALAASDWDGVISFIGSILDKVGAETISVRKWNENRLAYEINHKPRGTYILTYFRLEGPQVSVLEREVQLTEKIMRVLVLNVEHMTEEDLQKTTPSEKDEKRIADAEAKAGAKAAAPVEEPKAEEKPAKPKAPVEDAASDEVATKAAAVSDEPAAETEGSDKKEQ